MLRGVTIAGVLALCLASHSASAQSHPEFVAMPGVSKAALYKPDSGPAPHVGVLVMHRTSNYLAHRACTVCHLGNIAYALNRSLRWDPERDEIIGDAEASRRLDRPKREPWTL